MVSCGCQELGLCCNPAVTLLGYVIGYGIWALIGLYWYVVWRVKEWESTS